MKTDIIVCVHDSHDDVAKCLASLTPYLGDGTRLIIVDDGSGPQTQRLCERHAAEAPGAVRLIRRPQGSGFCRAANHGLRESDADMVVVLNSDTVVAGAWLEGLRRCLAARPDVGVAGPLSNAASWQSIPEFRGRDGNMAVNVLPDDVETIAEINAFCADLSRDFDYPFVEQVNGFCYAVRREVLDAVGHFDEEAFPEGYGEESDFCFRAVDAGFVCAIAIDSFVYHAKTKSYSSERRARLNAAGQKVLKARYGEERIRSAVRAVQNDPVMAAIRVKSRDLFAEIAAR